VTPERLAEIRTEIAANQCQECALDVELLAYVDELLSDRSTLRAEVERLRDYAAVVADRTLAHGDRWPDRWAAREHALTGVLDLIDKQREGE
jgi:hypothetical protein